MKKFVFIYFGFEPPTKESNKAWREWFASIGDNLVDSGSPFGQGIEITHDGRQQLILDKEAITGYSIINAANMNEAERMASTCPIITGIRVYESMVM